MTLRLREIDVLEGIVRQFHVVPGVLLEVIGVVAEEVHGLLCFTERFHSILADFQHEGGGDVVDALLHDVGDLAQQFGAFGNGCCAPAGECRRGRRQCRLDIRGLRQRKAAQSHLAIDRATAFLVRGSRDVLAAYEHGMRATELRKSALQRLLESLVNLFRRIEHRSVGQTKSHAGLPQARGNKRVS